MRTHHYESKTFTLELFTKREELKIYFWNDISSPGCPTPSLITSKDYIHFWENHGKLFTLSAFHFFIEVFTIIRVWSISSNMLKTNKKSFNLRNGGFYRVFHYYQFLYLGKIPRLTVGFTKATPFGEIWISPFSF